LNEPGPDLASDVLIVSSQPCGLNLEDNADTENLKLAQSGEFNTTIYAFYGANGAPMDLRAHQFTDIAVGADTTLITPLNEEFLLYLVIDIPETLTGSLITGAYRISLKPVE
jgi:hypothetical protein